ncbi:MAG: hypothetical protein JWP72_2169 [Massilia sp.]|nr:hypothetical protein [Massilia sp.]
MSEPSVGKPHHTPVCWLGSRFARIRGHACRALEFGGGLGAPPQLLQQIRQSCMHPPCGMFRVSSDTSYSGDAFAPIAVCGDVATIKEW